MKKIQLQLVLLFFCNIINAQIICGGIAIHYVPTPPPLFLQPPAPIVVVARSTPVYIEREPTIIMRTKIIHEIDEPKSIVIHKEQQTTYENTRTIYNENTKVVTDYKCWNMTIHFLCRSAILDEDDNVNIYNVYKFMTKHPCVSIRMRAFADIQTGSYSENYELSKQRADVVKNELLAMGIKESRMLIRCEGCDFQPYSKNNWNRCVIIETL